MYKSKSNFYITIICLTFLTFSESIHAQSSHSKAIYTAFIHRDMKKWESVIKSIESSNSLNTVEEKLELISYYYGYIGYLIGIKDFENAEPLIEKGEKLIAQVLRVSPKNATAYSFKGSFIGFQIGVHKYKAIFLEAESKGNVNKAIRLDSENIQALIDKGNILFYAPALFGGNKKEALAYFQKAEKIIETNKHTDQNWVYLNLLTVIASAYESIDRPEEARKTYEKILQIEPDLIWVKNDLYPKLLAKIKS